MSSLDVAKGFTLELSSVLGRINITRLISVEDGTDQHVLSQTHDSHVTMKKISHNAKQGASVKVIKTRKG